MDYKKIINELIENIDEGIHVIDENCVTVFYNSKMAKLEKTKRHDVLGVNFKDSYPNISEDDSTLLKALRKQIPTINEQQTYLNMFGKPIKTINTTIPINRLNKTIAALEISKDVTTLSEMSDTIMALQNSVGDNNGSSRKEIKKYTFEDIVGEAKSFIKVVDNAKKMVNNAFSILIYGETGTGKELFAQSIHFAGPRRNQLFLAQNCAALPEPLLEGILFGTAKGGFTGAVDRAGLFEQASHGTLLLDEISAMPIGLQSKLLRVLQEGYIRRVGGTKDIPVDVRIIATSNEPLKKLLEQGRFRQDLYYRLSALTLNITPLRERKEDVILLANEFIKKHKEKFNCQVDDITDSAKEKLKAHDYKGNVRELENIIISAMAMMGDETVMDAHHINFLSQTWFDEKDEAFELDGMTLPEKLEGVEKSIIERAMIESGGNISKTAESIGITRQALQYKLKKYSRKGW